jgi:hypothetical protein
MFITGVNDTGDKLFSDKFIAGVIDTGVNPWHGFLVITGVVNSFANISSNFRKNLKWSYWDTHGFRENGFMKKTKAENLVSDFR